MAKMIAFLLVCTLVSAAVALNDGELSVEGYRSRVCVCVRV